MNKQLNILEILDRLAETERLAADLYGHFATLYVDTVEAHDVFVRMQRQESHHHNEIQQQRKALARKLGATDAIEVDLSSVEQINTLMRQKISDCELSLSEALGFAIAMETSGMEFAYRMAAGRYFAELEVLSDLLSEDDSLHVRELQSLKRLLFGG